jgi:predicted amidohydrolase
MSAVVGLLDSVRAGVTTVLDHHASPFAVRGSLARMLRKRHGELFDTYIGFFSEIAAEYEMYVVGGSIYLYDEDLDEVRNTCYVFDPHGEIVGYQEKLVVTEQDEGLCSPGDGIAVLPTEWGRLGVIVGSDALFPEPARALAVKGAHLLVAPAACSGPVMHRQVRQAFQTRVQENQLFGATAFLVGPNSLGAGQYAGRSAVLAPMELANRRSGVLEEVGTASVASFVACECDLDALYQLWDTADPPLRHRMSVAWGPLLSGFYESGMTLSQGYEMLEAAPEEAVPVRPPEVAVPGEEGEEAGEEGVIGVPVTEEAVEEMPTEESPDAESWPFESR